MQEIDNLILKHKGLVYAQLHKFCLIHDPDAESIAFEALYKALVNYDASKGTTISTVAMVYIYNALGSYIRSLNKQRQVQIISYNNIAYCDDNGEHEFVDSIADSADVEQDYLNKELSEAAMKCFNELYNKLTNGKHKTIIGLWRDTEFSGLTTDIARATGVSQSYVSQVINNFKFKMKKKLEDEYYA